MDTPLPQARRLAQTNYPIRIGSFAYSFVVLMTLYADRGASLGLRSLVLPALVLLIYPHLAFGYTQRARDSHAAELNNLLMDAVLLGTIAAQTGLALWPSVAFFLAIGVNNAVCGGPRRLVIGMALFAGSALAWYAAVRPGFHPDTGPVVTALCGFGIAVYVSGVGLILNWQNLRLVKNRNALRRREEQFRFIAEHAGDFVAVLDAAGRIRYTSGAYLERFDPNRIGIGAQWSALIEPSQRARAREFLGSLLNESAATRITLEFTGANGVAFELECAAHVMHEEHDGSMSPQLLVISRARSPREQEMESRFGGELRAREDAFGLLVTSVLGRVEYASAQVAKLLGRTPAALLGHTIEEFAEPIPASDSLMDQVWRALESGRPCRCKVLLVRSDGRLELAWAAVEPLTGHDSKQVLYAWTLLEESAGDQAAEQAASFEAPRGSGT